MSERTNDDPSAEMLVVLDCFQRVLGMVRSLCRRAGLAPHTDAANDCEQEVRLALWRAREKLLSLRGSERDAYAFAIARHAANRFLRRERGIAVHGVPLDAAARATGADREPLFPWPGEEQLPAGSLEEDLSHPELTDAYQALPKDHKNLLNLLFHEGLTVPEAAARLDVKVATAWQWRHRALRALRKRLRPPG
jgi:RNA polymerase sigma factor (sigma-70 family)